MKRFPTKSKFIPKNPQKYVGDVNNIIARSGLERRFMKYFDENPAILQYASEEFSIPYFYKIDGRFHRYFPDFIIKVKDRNGNINTLVIEVKCSAETREPVKGKKASKTFLTEVLTWEKNQAKWEAAEKFCEERGMGFRVLTEKHIKYNFGKK